MNAALLFIFTVVWMLCSELLADNILKYEDGISGQIKSPGYPGNYPNNANYTWIIRTGSHSANVTFRIIEMNIEGWKPCDDYLEIKEIEPVCFRLFKRCGHLKNESIVGRGKKIRVSFISDKRMTEKGFHLTWRVTLTPTKNFPETQVTTQKMLATTTKYKVRTTFKKIDVKTTALQQKTTSPISSQVTQPLTKVLPKTQVTTQKMLATTTKYDVRTTFKKIDVKTTANKRSSQVSSTVQAKITSTSGTTESTTEDTSTYKYISPTTSTTLMPESPSTVENTGRTTSPPTTSSSELPSSRSIQYSETKRTTLQKRSRPLTLSSTTRSSSVELTTLIYNAATKKEEKNTFDIQTVYLIIGSVVVAFFLLLVVCVCIYRSRNQTRSLQKNQCQQKRDEGARNVINSAYCKSVHVYDTIPFDAVCELETCLEENTEDFDEQSTLYDKYWRNEHDRAQPAMEEDNRDNAHTYDTCERFYFTLQATRPRSLTPPATPTTTQQDSTNVYHTLDTHFMNSSQPK